VRFAVDEKGWRSVYSTGSDPTVDIAANAREHTIAAPVAVKQLDVEPKLGGILPKVIFRKRRLAEHLMHAPELVLERSASAAVSVVSAGASCLTSIALIDSPVSAPARSQISGRCLV
jgi:hypothetical protein